MASGNFLSVINVLMQLRKVCNHPNLFETRPTTSPFALSGIVYETASLATIPLLRDPFLHVDFETLNMNLVKTSERLTAFAHHRIREFQAKAKLIEEIDSAPDPPPRVPAGRILLQIRSTTSQMPRSEAQKLIANPSRPGQPPAAPGTQRIVLFPNSPSKNSGIVSDTISVQGAGSNPSTPTSPIMQCLTITRPAGVGPSPQKMMRMQTVKASQGSQMKSVDSNGLSISENGSSPSLRQSAIPGKSECK